MPLCLCSVLAALRSVARRSPPTARRRDGVQLPAAVRVHAIAAPSRRRRDALPRVRAHDAHHLRPERFRGTRRLYGRM